MQNFEYYNPQHLYFGCGTFNLLATLPMPGKKAVIVTTNERLFVDRAIELLKQNNVECVVYDGIRPNPNTDNINEGARFAVENGCDFVVAVGGGSPVDASKCIGLLMHEGIENDIWDYVPYLEGHKIPTGCAPVICVSTTAGTGSEVTQSGVVSNDYIDVKLDVNQPAIFPTISIVDPELHISIPADFTACQGMDVVFHCLEGYLNKLHTPYSDMLYLTSLSYAAKALPVAYREPGNTPAREAMALASNLAGMGESIVDVMSLHAMAHTIGSFHHDIPHGVALSLFAPEAFKLYESYPIGTTSRMAIIAKETGYGDSAEDCTRFVIDLLKAIDLYDIDYSKYGIEPERYHEYARHTVVDIAPYMDKDEKTPTIDEIERIYRNAFERNKKNCNPQT